MGLFSTKEEKLVKRLKRAIAYNEPDRVKALITADNADVNNLPRGYNILDEAVTNGMTETVQFLLERGADANAKGPWSYTPLMRAADSYSDITDICQLLLDHGADVNAKGREGETALLKACYRDNRRTIRWLLEHGADANATTSDLKTPLHYLAEGGNREMVEQLIDKGARISAQMRDGSTPLHIAAQKGRVEIVKLLLEKGADASLTDRYMNTAADVCERQYPGLAALIRGEHSVQKKEEDAEREGWKLVASDEVARVTAKDAIGYSITETFNFNSRLYTHIARNLETGAESQTVKPFDALGNSRLLDEAHKELTRLGGKAQTTALDKPKPAIMPRRPGA